MKAVVLAGGQGTRLAPLTNNIPKPMVPVGRRRCADYSIGSLVRAGINSIIVTTGYMYEQVIRGLEGAEALGANIVYSIEHGPRGTAGAVKKNEPWLDGTFVVMSADVLADVDLSDLVRFHRTKGAHATMALTTVSEPTAYGIVGLDEAERIVQFKEKPAPEEVFSNLINAGIYVLEPEVLEHVPGEGMFDFSKNLFPKLLEEGYRMFGHRLSGLWMDIGQPEDLIAANRAIVAREGEEIQVANAEATGPVLLGENVTIEEGAVIEGPSMIGDRAHVGRGARLRRSFVHGRASIGPGTRLEDTIVMTGCSIGGGSLLTNSVLDENCTTGDGVTLRDCLLGRGTSVMEHTALHGEKIS